MCPGVELINRYVSGNCTADESQKIEKHMTECENCRRHMESVRPTIDNMAQSDTDKTVDLERSAQAQYPTESMPQVSTMAQGEGGFTAQANPDIEGYDILEHLPRGGQAVVYKALQKATKRNVAVKVLLQGPHRSPQAQYRFEREVDLAASLKHPNIVTIHDSGISHGQYYYVMEYIQGQTLEKHVESKNLSPRQIMTLFNKVCSAVAYAHQRGVMHRDLKPGNILVDDDGEPHILDFGLAKLVDGSEQNEQTVMTSIAGQVIGTLAFMSPEQAAGQTDEIDIRTDVYSIGMILYKIMTGEFPYDITGAMLATLQNIQQEEPVRPSSITRINSEIEAIILKSLEKEPERRYQSAAEMQQDIRGWLQGMPISARANNSLYMLRKLIIRHRYASTVVGLLLVIIISFCYVSFDLYLTSRKNLKELETTKEQWSAESITNVKFIRQRAFILFLQAWHNNDQLRIQRGHRTLTKGSIEKKAAGFLLDPRVLNEKQADFRREFSGQNQWFADFVIAEAHLKNNNNKDALNLYRRSYNTLKQRLENNQDIDHWAMSQIQARLDLLSSE